MKLLNATLLKCFNALKLPKQLMVFHCSTSFFGPNLHIPMITVHQIAGLRIFEELVEVDYLVCSEISVTFHT